LKANALILVAGEVVELLLGAENLCGGLRACLACGRSSRKIRRWGRCS